MGAGLPSVGEEGIVSLGSHRLFSVGCFMVLEVFVGRNLELHRVGADTGARTLELDRPRSNPNPVAPYLCDLG